MTEETVKAWVHTEDQVYDVWAPVDLFGQLTAAEDYAWVSLALVEFDEYICLRAKDIVFFRRDMTADEKQKRVDIAVAAKWVKEQK